jgi:hypothetical protein
VRGDRWAAQAWPQQLALVSGKSVYNTGVPGYGPVHGLINTPAALKKHPQWLVSALYDSNDLYDAFRLSTHHLQIEKRLGPRSLRMTTLLLINYLHLSYMSIWPRF